MATNRLNFIIFLAMIVVSLLAPFSVSSSLHAQQQEEVPYGVEAECKPDKDKGEELNTENCGILYYAQKIIDVMTALVGVVVVIMIIVGGIQYSASRNDPGAVAAAKQKIVNAVIALLVYIFMWAFLQWIIPGGVL